MKTDWRNKLGRDRLESCLRISEGKSIEEFNPDEAIKAWYEISSRTFCPMNFSSETALIPKKVRRLHQHPIVLWTLPDTLYLSWRTQILTENEHF